MHEALVQPRNPHSKIVICSLSKKAGRLKEAIILLTIQSYKRFCLLRHNFTVLRSRTYAQLDTFNARGFKGVWNKTRIRDAKVKSVSTIEVEAIYSGSI